MKKQVFLILYIIAIAFCNCDNKIEKGLLFQTDSLLTINELDSAKQILSVLSKTSLSRQEKEWFHLLQAILKYKENAEYLSDTLFDKSVCYYEKEDDKKKLALALIYKGTLLIKNGEYVEAAKILKRAEEAAKGSKSEEVAIRSKAMLSLLNSVAGNNQLSLDYAKKTLFLATQCDNKRWIGYALNHLSVVFENIGMSDSSTYYSLKAIDYVQYQPKTDQPVFLNNLAIEYMHKKQYEKAENILKQSLDIQPSIETFGKLAQLYTDQQRTREAAALWRTVLDSSDLSRKAQFLYNYSEWLQQQERFAEACQVEKERAAIKDTLYKKQQTEAVMNVQSDFDHQNNIIFWQRWAIRGLCILMTLFVFFCFREYRLWKRKQKQDKYIADNQQLISTYETQLETMHQEYKLLLSDKEQELVYKEEKDRLIKELERKVELLRNEQNRLLTVGKTLYENILHGGKAISWKKRDYESFLEFYRTIAPEYSINLNLKYPSLTPQMKFYLSLLKIGNTSEDASNIMGLSPTAHRKLKSRIKSYGYDISTKNGKNNTILL